ncbi:MAG: PQQ-binding-like beta-propeller repeat protein [Acidimicrobiales bacterium]
MVAVLSASWLAGGPPGASAATSRPRATPIWPLYGHDLANTRENPSETLINPGSLRRLKKVWSTAGMVGVTSTPVVVSGVCYFGDWNGTLWALNAATGKVRWSADVGGSIIGSPAVAGNRVFVGVGSSLIAFNKKTGNQLWEATTNDNQFSQINASPVVVGNLVIEGTAQFEEVVGKAPFTFRGNVAAFNVATGSQVWNFYTTADDATSGAGGGVWSTPAVDTALGLLYEGTGQNISDPPGPLEDSLLAISYHTGRLAWSHQFTASDVFSSADNFSGKDYDVGASPNLWRSGGQEVVGDGSKDGVYSALNAATGTLLWQTPLTPGSVFGGALGSAAYAGGRIIASSNIGNPATNALTNNSTIFALNPQNGAVEWKHDLAGNVYGPISATKKVAFVGTDNSSMIALDIKTGKQLWSFSPPGKVGGGASIVGGRLLWGYGFTLFGGPGPGGVISFGLKAR